MVQKVRFKNCCVSFFCGQSSGSIRDFIIYRPFPIHCNQFWLWFKVSDIVYVLRLWIVWAFRGFGYCGRLEVLDIVNIQGFVYCVGFKVSFIVYVLKFWILCTVWGFECTFWGFGYCLGFEVLDIVKALRFWIICTFWDYVYCEGFEVLRLGILCRFWRFGYCTCFKVLDSLYLWGWTYCVRF